MLLPVQPTFLLELVDLLLHKLSDFIKIVVISQSAFSVVQYANINLEYLNQKLQDKIYLTENPLSFDKLLKSKRMRIFSNVQEYLNSKKTAVGLQGKKIIPNDYQRELLITSHESLRLGDVAYLLQNLNMQHKKAATFKQPGTVSTKDFSLILTDPLVGNSDLLDNLLLKPFLKYNKINVIKQPITAAIACCNIKLMADFLKKLKPKRVLCNKKAHELMSISGESAKFDFVFESSLVESSIVDISPITHASSVYVGTCPLQVAADLELSRHEQSGSSICRLRQVDLEIQDQKYKIKQIRKPSLLERLSKLKDQSKRQMLVNCKEITHLPPEVFKGQNFDNFEIVTISEQEIHLRRPQYTIQIGVQKMSITVTVK